MVIFFYSYFGILSVGVPIFHVNAMTWSNNITFLG